MKLTADFISHARGIVRTADLMAYRHAREAGVTLDTIVAKRYLRDLAKDDMPPPAAPALPAPRFV